MRKQKNYKTLYENNLKKNHTDEIDAFGLELCDTLLGFI